MGECIRGVGWGGFDTRRTEVPGVGIRGRDGVLIGNGCE